MIYIKYIWKDDPNDWYICTHEKGSKKEIMILDSDGHTYSYTKEFNLKNMREYYKIRYLTQKQIDLLKLELL